MENKNMILNQLAAKIEKAKKLFSDAMARDDFNMAFVYGKQISDLEQIYYYHNK